MSPAEILTQARRAGVALHVTLAGRLGYTTKGGPLPDDLRRLLKDNKARLLDLLTQPGPKARTHDVGPALSTVPTHPAASVRCAAVQAVNGLPIAANRVLTALEPDAARRCQKCRSYPGLDHHCTQGGRPASGQPEPCDEFRPYPEQPPEPGWDGGVTANGYRLVPPFVESGIKNRLETEQ